MKNLPDNEELKEIEFKNVDFDGVEIELFKNLKHLPLASLSFRDCVDFPSYFWLFLTEVKSLSIIVERISVIPSMFKDEDFKRVFN